MKHEIPTAATAARYLPCGFVGLVASSPWAAEQLYRGAQRLYAEERERLAVAVEGLVLADVAAARQRAREAFERRPSSGPSQAQALKDEAVFLLDTGRSVNLSLARLDEDKAAFARALRREASEPWPELNAHLAQRIGERLPVPTWMSRGFTHARLVGLSTIPEAVGRWLTCVERGWRGQGGNGRAAAEALATGPGIDDAEEFVAALVRGTPPEVEGVWRALLAVDELGAGELARQAQVAADAFVRASVEHTWVSYAFPSDLDVEDASGWEILTKSDGAQEWSRVVYARSEEADETQRIRFSVSVDKRGAIREVAALDCATGAEIGVEGAGEARVAFEP